ncbi:MAG: MFS transporter [Rhodovibrionaceae bacterium]
MTRTIAPIATLLLSAAVLLLGNGLQGTLIPIRAQLESYSTFEIGILGSSYFLGFALGCGLGPRTVRRVGHIRAFTAMAALASTVALAHALVTTPMVWVPLRAITGFCFAVLYIVIESWLNERATNENRGRILSLYTIINLTVITLGQMMVTLHDPESFPLFSVASILVSLAAVPLALTASPAPEAIPLARIRLRHLYRISPVGFIGCLAVGLANGSFWSLAPVYTQDAGMTIAGTALFMSVAVIGGAVGQWPLGRISDRMDRRRVIVASCLLSAALGIALVLAGGLGRPVLLTLVFGFGFMALPLYSLSVAHTNDYVAPGEFVEASSGLLMIYAAGAVAGPMLASLVMGLTGQSALFGFIAAVHLLMCLFALYRMRRRGSVSATDKPDFIAVPGNAPTAYVLHPAVEEEERAEAETAVAVPGGSPPS